MLSNRLASFFKVVQIDLPLFKGEEKLLEGFTWIYENRVISIRLSVAAPST
jgi:hypothetical protein